MTFSVAGEPLSSKYVNDYDLIDQFVGGQLWTVGANAYGILGDNTVADKSSPVQTIASGTNWKQVSCGQTYCAAIRTDGTLWLWGLNQFGDFGNNASGEAKSSPVQTVAGGSNWKQVSVGYTTMAVKTDGTLWGCGYNQYGQLGDNSIAHKSSPVQTVAGGTNWKYVNTYLHLTAAIKTDGTLWLWGSDSYGQLGDNSLTKKSSPVQTVAGGTTWKSVSCGYAHALAIKTDGTLWSWGKDDYGQLGNNSLVHQSSPTQTVATGTNWKSVSCGDYHSAAIKTDGTLWNWGRNNVGQLGDNSATTAHKSSPVQTVAGGTNWKQVSCGKYHTGAIKSDGTAWLWGTNSYANLGDNTLNVHKSSPVQTVTGGTNWKQVSCGLKNSMFLTFTDQS